MIRIGRAVFLFAVASTPAAQSQLILNDVNLIDGASAPARPHMRIEIRGDRIEAAGRASSAAPSGAVL